MHDGTQQQPHSSHEPRMSAWLGVVSAAHVSRGVELGIAQISHGNRAGLARMKAGDTLVYYSPIRQFGDRIPYQCFTAMGMIADAEIWQATEGDFRPFRRRVDYLETRPVPLVELREQLHLTQEPNWGYKLRFGLIALDDHDIEVLRGAMSA